MITVEEICAKSFTKVSKGYDPDRVDEYLDTICDVLDKPDGVVRLSAVDIASTRFNVVENGYDRREVSAFLDHIANEIKKEQHTPERKEQVKSILGKEQENETKQSNAHVWLKVLGMLLMALAFALVYLSDRTVGSGVNAIQVANLQGTIFAGVCFLASIICFVGAAIVKAIDRKKG